MKTLCFTLGLLLLAACCCNAMPKALTLTLPAPQSCCFKFYQQNFPLKYLTNITKSHRSCPTKAFIIQTVKGKQICYSRTSEWALSVYKEFQKAEGSGTREH